MSIYKCTYLDATKKCMFFFRIEGEFVVLSTFHISSLPSYQEMLTAIDNFITEIKAAYPEAGYIVNYPGTRNPLFARAVLETVKQRNRPHRIFYGGELLDNKIDPESDNFIADRLNPLCAAGMTWEAQIIEDARFLACSVCFSLRSECAEPIPWRYYVIDATDTLVAEQIQKPESGKFMESVSLREQFQTGTLQFIDDVLHFTARE